MVSDQLLLTEYTTTVGDTVTPNTVIWELDQIKQQLAEVVTLLGELAGGVTIASGNVGITSSPTAPIYITTGGTTPLPVVQYHVYESEFVIPGDGTSIAGYPHTLPMLSATMFGNTQPTQQLVNSSHNPFPCVILQGGDLLSNTNPLPSLMCSGDVVAGSKVVSISNPLPSWAFYNNLTSGFQGVTYDPAVTGNAPMPVSAQAYISGGLGEGFYTNGAGFSNVTALPVT